MAELEFQRRIKAHRDLVWRVISDVAGMATYAPYVTRVEILEGKQLGMRCRFFGHGDRCWEEECIAWEEGSHYAMRVDTDSYPFTFSALEYRFSVEEREKGVAITGYYSFRPKYGLIGQLLDRARLKMKFEENCSELLEHWIRDIHAKEWVYQNTVAVVLGNKGYEIVTAKRESSVEDVAKLMAGNRIGSVVIVNDTGTVAGVLSERDIVRHLGTGDTGVLSRTAGEIMTHAVIVCRPENNMLEVLSMMSSQRCRHLPVIGDDGRMIGIISIGDVVNSRLAELEAESESLRHSIEARLWHDNYVGLGPAGLEVDQDALASGADKP